MSPFPRFRSRGIAAAWVAFAAVTTLPLAAHAAGTETAAKARQGKLAAADSAAVQRAQLAHFQKEVLSSPASSPVPTTAPLAPSGTAAAPPQLMRELQADKEAGGSDLGHIKVIGGLALLLLVGYAAYRRLTAQG